MTRIIAGYKAFQKPQLVTDPLRLVDDKFGEWDARRLRYAIYWGFYENTAYDTVHTWAQSYKTTHGLYRYIRNIYNPSYRLGEFWKAHLWGGRLDPMAGSGQERPSALPIQTEHEEIRQAIALIWKWSNWQLNKGIVGQHGAVLGDVAIRVIEDAERGKVCLDLVHPGTIADIDTDAYGNVKGYQLQEERYDPRPGASKTRPVTYAEEARRDGERVLYKTYLNGNPFPWNGVAAEWETNWGFVPMVLVQHNRVGMEWGWSEIHAGRSKFHEADDLASKLDDYIRKTVASPAMITKVEKPKTTPRASQTQHTGQTASDNPQPGREETPILYAPEGAEYIPMIAPLDIEAAGNRIQSILSEIERDFPELQMDIWAGSGEQSGRALRTARQRTETKVQERRAGYDDALVRVLQMAIAIGGERGLFPGFGLSSYAAGQLDFQIADRPVFAVDPLDQLEIDKLFWEVANSAIKAGVPLVVYLRREGWSDKEIAELQSNPEFRSRQEMMQLALQGQRAMGQQEEGRRSEDGETDEDSEA